MTKKKESKIEELKRDYEAQIQKLLVEKAKIYDEMLMSKNTTVASLKKSYEEGEAKVRADCKKEVEEITAEMWRQNHKYEDEHVKLIDAVVERDGARNLAEHYRLRLAAQLRAQLENGYRRAQADPNYAVIRELLHAGNDLSKVDFMAVAKAHPEATIFGMVMISEELGYKINMDVKTRDEAIKQSSDRWDFSAGGIKGYTRILRTMMSSIDDEYIKAEDRKISKEKRT